MVWTAVGIGELRLLDPGFSQASDLGLVFVCCKEAAKEEMGLWAYFVRKSHLMSKSQL